MHSARALLLENPEILPTLVILEPRSGNVIRKSAYVRVDQLAQPRLFRTHRRVTGARFANGEMFIVFYRKGIVEIPINAGKTAAGARVDVDTDHVDAVGAGKPLLQGTAWRGVGGLEHEDFGVRGDGGVDVFPGSDEFGSGWGWTGVLVVR